MAPMMLVGVVLAYGLIAGLAGCLLVMSNATWQAEDHDLYWRIAHQKPPPLQTKDSVKDVRGKLTSLLTERSTAAFGVKAKYHPAKAVGSGHHLETALIRGIMAPTQYYCFERQSVAEARSIMRRHDLQYLPS